MNIDYLKWTLSFYNVKKYVTGSTRIKLTKNDAGRMEFLLPDLKSQKQIASILETADRARQKRKAANTLPEQFLQSSFLHLFGDPVRNEKGWDMKPLIDCVTMKGGGTPDTSNDAYYNGNIPWVPPKDMKFGYISTSIDKITQQAVEESSTKLIEPGNVLLVVRSGILKRLYP